MDNPRTGKIGPNRERVANLRKAHSDWTLVRIGMEIGITKERVRQILVKLGLPTRRVRNES